MVQITVGKKTERKRTKRITKFSSPHPQLTTSNLCTKCTTNDLRQWETARGVYFSSTISFQVQVFWRTSLLRGVKFICSHDVSSTLSVLERSKQRKKMCLGGVQKDVLPLNLADFWDRHLDSTSKAKPHSPHFAKKRKRRLGVSAKENAILRCYK